MDKCVILYNAPREGAAADEYDVLDEVAFVEKGLLSLGISAERVALKDDLTDVAEALSAREDIFVFNLVESVFGHDELIHFAPSLLRLHGIPYTGTSDTGALMTGDKLLAKRLMRLAGIAVASDFRFTELDKLEAGRKYIMKPVNEDGSVGITEDCVFRFDGVGLPEVLRSKLSSAWFIEEYIEGREINVSVIHSASGPQVLPAAEICFLDYPDSMPKIVSYKAKWDEESFQYRNSVRTFGTIQDKAVIDSIRTTALKCWELFGLAGYARVDMRLSAEGVAYVLEVNANPCISEGGGFVAACREGGMNDGDIIKAIISDLN